MIRARAQSEEEGEGQAQREVAMKRGACRHAKLADAAQDE